LDKVEEDKIGHGGVTTSALAAAIFDGRSSVEREDDREASITTRNLTGRQELRLSLSLMTRDFGSVALQFNPYENFQGKVVAITDH
jgi:hypothetical protein